MIKIAKIKNNSQDTSKKEIDRMYLDYAAQIADMAGTFTSGSVRTSTATADAINNLMMSPEANYAALSDYTQAIYKENGVVAGNIKYFQSHLTYNHFLYPIISNKSNSSLNNANLEEYMKAANYLEMYRIKYFAPYFIKQTFLNGVSYFYKISDSSGVTYMEFPPSMCRIYSHSDGVFRWEVDASKLSNVTSLPKKLSSAIEKGAPDDPLNDKNWSDDGVYYRVGDEGVAFSLDYSVMSTGGKTSSEFSSTILDAIRVRREKDNLEMKDTLDTTKIIHSKIPIDKDGVPQMPSKTAKLYDNALKRSLPKGISGITSPLDINVINMDKSGNHKVYSSLDKSTEQVFMSTGTPSNLFGASTTSSNIVKLAIQKDANWLFTKVLPLLESYYNYEMSKYKNSSGLSWRVGFVRQSNFTMKDDVQIVKEGLSNGGSRLMYMASTGLTPSQVFGLLVSEQQALDIDSIMVPKATSFNTSGSESEKTGRPETDEPTDDTDRISDAT